MIKLFKLHVSLFKYLQAELKKKRTTKELVYFLRDLVKAYFREIIKLYKELFLSFDPEYKKKKKEYNAYMKTKQDVQRILRLFDYINTELLVKMGKTKEEKKQIRRDLYEYGRLDKDVFERLMKELG